MPTWLPYGYPVTRCAIVGWPTCRRPSTQTSSSTNNTSSPAELFHLRLQLDAHGLQLSQRIPVATMMRKQRPTFTTAELELQLQQVGLCLRRRRSLRLS